MKEFSKKEEYQRSAVGRYYYACYLIARDIYNKKKNRKPGEKIPHTFLIDHFKNSSNKTEKNIGESLDELFDYRKKADYDLKFDLKKVKTAKKLSEELLESFKMLKNKK